MQKLLQLFLVLVLGTVANQSFAALDIGDVMVEGSNAIAIQVSGASGELDAMAHQAFAAHGAYRRVTSGGAFEIRFSSVGANQVNVQVIKGGSVILNQNANGTSTRNAFYRAADAAVKATSGLNGFFAAKLAFISNRTGKDEVYVGDLFMGEVKQITRDNAFALTPRWSPEGSRLIYTSYFKSGFPDIYLINLANNDRTKFASFQGTNSGARFSPNGLKVAMVLSGEGTPEIYSAPASGKPVSRLTRSDAVKSSPCFSPDSSRIVYASEPGPQLYIMSASGGGSQRVGGGLGSYCAEPDWSRADPSKIAFTFRDGSRFQIAVLDLKTGQSKKVSKAVYDGVEPNWLADGRHLIYTARAAGSRALVILDTESGRTVRLGNISAEKASVWGPQ
ncbi:MAG: PD40 domain-containing protein [Verrucomicrobia bacterium]|nr:PD40 domain-containing protein [Verrucomicrobiota bacterium]